MKGVALGEVEGLLQKLLAPPPCIRVPVRLSAFGFRLSAFGFRVLGFGFRVSSLGFSGSRVSDFGFRVLDFSSIVNHEPKA